MPRRRPTLSRRTPAHQPPQNHPGGPGASSLARLEQGSYWPPSPFEMSRPCAERHPRPGHRRGANAPPVGSAPKTVSLAQLPP